MESLALKRKYTNLISQIYQNYGFPPLVCETEINVEQSSEEYEKFLQNKQKEDQERGLQALVDMQKQEEKADDVPEYSGPLVIGLTITR